MQEQVLVRGMMVVNNTSVPVWSGTKTGTDTCLWIASPWAPNGSVPQHLILAVVRAQAQPRLLKDGHSIDVLQQPRLSYVCSRMYCRGCWGRITKYLSRTDPELDWLELA